MDILKAYHGTKLFLKTMWNATLQLIYSLIFFNNILTMYLLNLYIALNLKESSKKNIALNFRSENLNVKQCEKV